ncbi:MAG: hypothetical protein AB7T01_01995 [Acidithiobacillus sp.]
MANPKADDDLHMEYGEINVSDDYLCGDAFTADNAPDLLIAAAWAINGYRTIYRVDEDSEQAIENIIDDDD